ncbi:MAG: DHH family phosphoesterase [Oscillospiraceae bacterium]|nr:DHH family phosphoesterase [Oscillospiraceae bacterium]
MKKGRNLFNISLIGLFIIAFVFSVVTAFYSTTASFIELAVTTVSFAVFIIYSKLIKREAFSFLSDMSLRLSPENRDALSQVPMPVCIVNEEDEFVWYNDKFSIEVLGGENILGDFFSEKFQFSDRAAGQLFCGEHKYTTFSYKTESQKQSFTIYYFVDDTALKNEAAEFARKKPSVVHILIDNYDELMDSANGSQKNFLVSRIESALEKAFVTESDGFFRKIEKDRFVAIIDNQHLKHFIEDKFSILDKIHKTVSTERLYATLSIGIGQDAGTLKESDIMARQALDMALGRGGDQAAIKSAHGFEFFGGLSKGVEKRAKVRSRMISSALRELVLESDNVILMGHKMADFDCLGAAVGLYKAITSVSKPVHICIDREKNLSRDLIDYLSANGMENAFISPSQATGAISKKTLLVVLDTHNPDFVECPELLSKASDIVVIDHHRKMVNFIDNSVIFYHEPSASSASEMVTELVQYFGDNAKVSKFEAEALLSGIMLDTKNFIIKSGVRTFEAAAYLRRAGADLVKVNHWFASNIETYHQRAKLISAAEIVRGCAISFQDEFTDELLLAVPQTADELLRIQNVSASFVMYLRNGVVSISARSFGAVNVQLIMEKLGGGGHLTMAGAQIKAESCAPIREMLLEAIDSYFKENASTQK